MDNFQETIRRALIANEKGISDLMTQDMNLGIWAYVLKDHPSLELALDQLFQQTYLNTCQLMEDLLYQLNNSLSPVQEQELKQEVQLYVQELITQKKRALQEKIRWMQYSDI